MEAEKGLVKFLGLASPWIHQHKAFSKTYKGDSHFISSP